MTEQRVITAKGLSKRYGELRAVDAIDFEVFSGECIAILGPNGAGKTTTISMCLGLTEPTAGDLSVLGFSIPQHARLMRQQVGVVPQMDCLDPDLSVLENLQVYSRYFSKAHRATAAYLEELLTFMSLAEKRDATIRSLSGGMQRRLSLARALVNRPKVLFLDEPTTGLDPQARQLLWTRLRELKKQGTTIVLTTHYLEEAERLCDRVLLIDHGKVLACDTPRQLVSDNIEPQVFEIYTDAVLMAEQSMPLQRQELVGDTLWGYCEDEAPMLSYLQQKPDVDFRHRQANLEDVFLKLTGRELRE